jgi:flavin-dependent dehydrogenase
VKKVTSPAIRQIRHGRDRTRKPFGDGWALAGDAGFLKDPIMGTGIDDAFRDAEFLSEALDEAFSGRKPWDEALGGFQQRRDASQEGKYEFIVEMAKLNFTPEFLAMLSGGAPAPAAV